MTQTLGSVNILVTPQISDKGQKQYPYEMIRKNISKQETLFDDIHNNVTSYTFIIYTAM